MPANEANPIYLSERERRDLEALVRQQTCAQQVALRARIVLLASKGVGIQPSATRLGIARTTVRNWRRRWLASTGNRVAERLADAPRPGMPANLQRRGCLRDPDPQFAEKCHDICQTYRLAPERAAAGIPTFSIGEMTGIQALERIAPTLSVKPGRVEQREFEYTRHGTCTLIASFNVATGEVSADTGETHTEEDFPAHLAALVQQPRMHLVMDNLNTHYSESVVRLVAERIGFEGDLGHKGRCGILRNASSRQAFLSDPDRPLAFHFTPKHAPWLNQIEIWFSILVCELIRRGNFQSKSDLAGKIGDFINYFNEPWPNFSVGHIKPTPSPFDHERYHYFCSAVLGHVDI